jgi:hypothetical protein
MKKLLIGVAIAATALFGLTACGGYDDSESGETGTSSVFDY